MRFSHFSFFLVFDRITTIAYQPRIFKATWECHFLILKPKIPKLRFALSFFCIFLFFFSAFVANTQWPFICDRLMWSQWERSKCGAKNSPIRSLRSLFFVSVIFSLLFFVAKILLTLMSTNQTTQIIRLLFCFALIFFPSAKIARVIHLDRCQMEKIVSAFGLRANGEIEKKAARNWSSHFVSRFLFLRKCFHVSSSLASVWETQFILSVVTLTKIYRGDLFII